MASSFDEIYRYLRLSHYKKLFSVIREKAGSLTATEAFSAEIIYLLKNPTVNDFAQFIAISQPNATYKINALVEKGYVIKTTCEQDKRECRLEVTKKFMDYYGAQIPDFAEITDNMSLQEQELLKKLSDSIAAVIGEKQTHNQQTEEK